MESVILLFASVLASSGMLFFAAPVARRVGLVDHPDARKTHRGQIPLVGGVVVTCVAALMVLFVTGPTLITYSITIAAIGIAIMGLLDDRFGMGAKVRLAFQLSIITFLFYHFDIGIFSVGNIFNTGDIPLGLYALPMTLIIFAGVINAFNMTDGIDGLCGSTVLVSLGSLIVLIYNHVDQSITNALFILCGCLVAFLVFNLQLLPRLFTKVFLGDAGSMTLGLVVIVTCMRFSQGEQAVFSPTTAIWIIAYPCFDMATTMFGRIKRGVSPMTADRTHLHHLLMDYGFNARQTLLIIVFTHSALCGIGMLIETIGLPDYVSISAFSFALFIYVLMILALSKSHILHISRKSKSALSFKK